MKSINSKKGFTIIEVVLVLAIGGLIFLMVFLGFPALQRTQNDTTRRNDLARFGTQLQQYSSNNRGKVPTADKWQDFVKDYLAKVAPGTNGFEVEGNEFVDPDGQPYQVQFVADLKNATDQTLSSTVKSLANAPFGQDVGTDIKAHTIYVYTYAGCDGENIVKSTGARRVAFQYKLENAGVYCGTN